MRTHAIRFVARKSLERWREAIEDHREDDDALETRDGPLLGELLREHLRHKVGMVNEAMAALAAKEAAE